MKKGNHLGTSIVLSQVKFTAAGNGDFATGLLGYVTAILNGRLRIDGLTLRRTAAGRLAISFPARKDAAGREHPIVQPIDRQARRDIEAQILAALGNPRSTA